MLGPMPRDEASTRHMYAQVQGRTLERQADGLRQALCQLAEGRGGVEEAQRKIAGMRLQLDLAERLALELAAAGP
jgi:hypothetical protein